MFSILYGPFANHCPVSSWHSSDLRHNLLYIHSNVLSLSHQLKQIRFSPGFSWSYLKLFYFILFVFTRLRLDWSRSILFHFVWLFAYLILSLFCCPKWNFILHYGSSMFIFSFFATFLDKNTGFTLMWQSLTYLPPAPSPFAWMTSLPGACCTLS